ncbi:pentapeptide repeat-containing protein [Nostoc sp. UHCC 0702]|nr:pentapeptide repeat-containing protein [Nostoc sp. UHCC 0702]
MTVTNRHQISLYQEAKAGLNSLFKQTAQVGVGFLVMLLLTGGKPPAFTVALSCVLGIGFVAWSEEKRISQQRVTNKKSVPKEEIPEQVKLLLQANTENFSELVKSAGLNPAEDFAGANLASIKAIGCNLSGFNFSGADLTQADFSRADLSNADFSDANLRSAQLSRANLTNANLSNALLIDANFSHADIRNANLSGADLINADISSADLSGANLTETNFTDTKVKNAQFGSNAGLTDDVKSELEQRRAIFPQDQPALI